MKRFGFGKKSDSDTGSIRSNQSGQSSAPPPDDNPYAQVQPADDPYANMNPYAAAPRGGGLPSGPRSGAGRPGLPSGPRSSSGSGASTYSAPPPSYKSNVSAPPASSGYGSDRYGSSNGYGSNRYNDGGSGGGYGDSSYGGGPAASSGIPGVNNRRGGGYGGFDDQDEDANRAALLGGAKERYAPPQRSVAPTPQDDTNPYGASGIASSNTSGGYGPPRELTQEEQEEQDVDYMKQETKQLRGESVQSLQRSVARANEARQNMHSTLARLGAQADSLNRTEQNLDQAHIQQRIAMENTKELKKLNGSMFAIHVANPFTAKQRDLERDAAVMAAHRADKDAQAETRRDAYDSGQRMQNTMRDLDGPRQLGVGRMSKLSEAERSKFLFEDDDSDREAEDKIDNMQNELSTIVSELNIGARAIGKEVEAQNALIDRIALKSDAVDDGVRLTRDKLGRIK